MSAAEKFVRDSTTSSILANLALARTYDWRAPIEDVCRHRPGLVPREVWKLGPSAPRRAIPDPAVTPVTPGYRRKWTEIFPTARHEDEFLAEWKRMKTTPHGVDRRRILRFLCIRHALSRENIYVIAGRVLRRVMERGTT